MSKPTVGKILTYPGNANVMKIQVAALYAGVNLDIDYNFEFNVTNYAPEFLKKYPLGKVPVMETPDGPLTESEAMMFYVTNSVPNSIVGANLYEKALIQKYVMFGANEIMAPIGRWILPVLGHVPYAEPAVETSKQQLQRALKALDADIGNKTYFVGDRITVADISLAGCLHWGYTKLFDPPFRAVCPNLNRWFMNIVSLPHFKTVMGDVVMCEHAIPRQGH